MRRLPLVLFVALASGYPRAQSNPPLDGNVLLQVSVVGNQQEFRIGETIPLQLSFSAALADQYQIITFAADRRHRTENVSVDPADGAVDPLANRQPEEGGGLAGYEFLSKQPWTTTLRLNEWVRFTRPGQYRIAITSARVGVKDPSHAMGTSPVMVRANPIALTIVPATGDWQQAVFGAAVATLNQPVPSGPRDADYLARRQALDALRFLGTPEATREFATRMRGGPLDYLCRLGLIYAPDLGVARSALEDALSDPDHPIDGDFVDTLTSVSSDPREPAALRMQQRRLIVGKLIAALPHKRGAALSTSLMTAVNEAWNGASVSAETTNRLVQQLIAGFDQLGPERQAEILGSRWDKIGGPAMLPILRRYAQTYTDPFVVMGSASHQASASALQHWYELDPAAARPVIISEIIRPRPQYDARVLGILPDKTLPEVDAALAANFAPDYDRSNVASLIARYATDAILPSVLAKADPLIGRWSCAPQGPILAYVLRANPVLAKPRIERALASRGQGFSGCYRFVLQSIADIRYDPVLEDIAIRSLDDPDLQVVSTAATVLGRFGSSEVESVLRQHYVSWSNKWTGRESELNPAMADQGGFTDEVRLGYSLLEALTTGTSWLTDESKLHALAPLAKGMRLQQLVADALKAWSNQPLTIAFYPHSGGGSFVAQYRNYSMDALETKLAQFPSGTKFKLYMSASLSPADTASRAALLAFLTAHGMVLVEGRH